MAAGRSTLLRVVLAVVVVVVVLGTSTLWWPSPAEPPPAADAPAGRTSGGGEDTVVVEARTARRAGAVRREPPTAVRLPGGPVVAVQAVSSRTDGVLDVPADVERAGWWRGGSALGDPFGSTLLAAHVDSRTQGLGPFAELLEARTGDRFEVTSAGLRQSFTTTSVRLLERSSALRRGWLYRPTGDRRLVMVTCAPPYVPARGGYQRLAVVVAEPVSLPQPRNR
ncbi:class F sortase [Nocardioides aurantiacus]|uniref:Sortase family protein n=1 Tax=Nocardioides aurantiacus TaxID=86796 RepID=A0A3N2CS90_9ACTN|nr:class F sortase [Nocardioides aurantiacus]ROR90390.1 sortase family protein [Nocardioides aurantiacus]